MKRLLIAVIVSACLLPSAAMAYHLPWCGIYMSHYFHILKRSLWVAANWRFEGSPAGGPAVGAVVVWPHHVGVIAGGPNARGMWLVHSGNDGNAVRTRYRSLRGAIAYRWVGSGPATSEHHYGEVQQETARGRNKHLVALAVGRRARAIRLRQAGTLAEGAGFVSPAPFALAQEAHFAHEVVGHHRQAMRQSGQHRTSSNTPASF